MDDLHQCTVIRDDLQRWLAWGSGPLTIYQEEDALLTLLKAEKNSSLDYLYKMDSTQNGSISWDHPVVFFGVSQIQSRTLYLTKDALKVLSDCTVPFVTETTPSMINEICGGVNQRLESMIANDRNNLVVRELTSRQVLYELECCRGGGALEEARQRFMKGEEPDGQFRGGYALSQLPEDAFIDWIQDSESFIQAEAERYIGSQQEKLLLQFLKQDLLLAEYQALAQDASDPIHRMKAITEAVKTSGAKMVTVTVEKPEGELTFKASADSLTGYRNFYGTCTIPAAERRKFERLFGRHANYTASEVTKITYGRNTIYEASPAPAEDMTEKQEMSMGGMSL